MKKVGIITFHTVLNYGGALQAVALYTFIKSLGFDVKLIDYHNDIFDKQSDPHARYGNVIKDTLRILFFAQKKERLAGLFRNFVRTNTELSECFNAASITEANKQFDVFVTGSDQVFNLDITGQDKNFLLEFATSEKTRTSYAASFGGYSVERCLEMLKSFDSVSIREEESAKTLSIKGVSATTHIDPTFLVDKEFWESLSEVPKEKNYVLLYTLGNGSHVDKLIDEAKHYAVKHKKKLLYINNGYNPFALGITYKCRVSPQQFLGLFAHASLVFTNSFHGTAFSVIFQKEFYVDSNLPKGKGERIRNLFNVLDISCRQYDSQNRSSSIDWDMIDSNIRAERNRSKSYLMNLLQDADCKLLHQRK